MIQKRWFRVGTLPDGSISSDSCEVDVKGKNGTVYRYYEAASLSEACEAAKEWYARTHARDNARYQKTKASGMCPCGCRGPARPGKTTCQAKVDRISQRAKERESGRPLLKIGRHVTPDAALAAVRAGQASRIKRRGGNYAELLRRYLSKFDKLGPEAFRAWLVSKINERSDAAHQVPTEEAQAAE